MKILTQSGRYIDPWNVKEEDVNFDDIVWSLSHICRFTGHTRFMYSVGQHSLLVSSLLEESGFEEHVQLQGLLHDASEA